MLYFAIVPRMTTVIVSILNGAGGVDLVYLSAGGDLPEDGGAPGAPPTGRDILVVLAFTRAVIRLPLGGALEDTLVP